MSITREQKDFIKKLAPGIHVYLQSDGRLENILENPKGEIELFIKNNLICREKNKVRASRIWFCEETFCTAVDSLIDEKLKKLLYYFDERDMPMCDVYVESCLCPRDLDETETRWGEQLIGGELMTFKDFLS